MITGTKPPHTFSEQHIYKIHRRSWSSLHHSSPGPPHLQHGHLGAMGWRILSVTSHMASGPFSLELPGSDKLPSDSHPLASGRMEILTLGLGGATICRPRQAPEEVVEETGAQSFVHPIAGEKHVVHLMHALNVACAVFLLSLQP